MTPPVEVVGLDALARIAAAAGDRSNTRDPGGNADQRMEGSSHFITNPGHVDAR